MHHVDRLHPSEPWLYTLAFSVLLGLLAGCAAERTQQPLTVPELQPSPTAEESLPTATSTPGATLAALRAAVGRGDLDTAATHFTPNFRRELAAWVQHAGAQQVLQSLRGGLQALPPESPYRVVRSDVSGARWETLCPTWPDAEAACAAARHVPGMARVHVEYAGLPFEYGSGSWLIAQW